MTTDPAKNFVQNLIQQEIRDIMPLLRRSELSEATQILQGLVLTIDDLPGLPPEFISKNYFKGRTVFNIRGAVPIVRQWLIKVNQWIDSTSQKTLGR